MIIDTLQIQDLPSKMTPAANEPLEANQNDMPAQAKYKYTSVMRKCCGTCNRLCELTFLTQ